MLGCLWRGGRQRGRSWRSRVSGRSTSKVTQTSQCPGLMNITLRVACPWPKTPRWGRDPEKDTTKTRNQRLQVHVDHVVNSVWSSTAVGILRKYLHWNSSSVFQGHLRHWISNPMGSFHPLWWFCLQYVKWISSCIHTNTHSGVAELMRFKVRHRSKDNLIQYVGITKRWHQYYVHVWTYIYT